MSSGKQKLVYLVILFFAFQFLSGCVSTQISNYSSLEKGQKYNKVFFEFHYIEQTKGFANSFCTSFSSALREKGVTSEFYATNVSNSTSRLETNNRMLKANSELLIIMTQSGFRGYKVFGPTGGTYQVKIYKPNSSKHIWRANLEVEADLGIKLTVEKAVRKLVASLEINGYL